MGICYIVGAGEFSRPFLPREDDFVIAADGGYDALKKYRIRCDLLMGDFDSISDMPSGIEILRFPIKKDETDMHLCYLEGARRGYTEFQIYGGTGGREDHTIANISLLLYVREHGGRATLFGEKNIFTVIKNESAEFSAESGKHFSAFALFGKAEGISIRGLEYECENISLTPDFPLAVSNRFIGSRAHIKVDTGCLLVVVER